MRNLSSQTYALGEFVYVLRQEKDAEHLDIRIVGPVQIDRIQLCVTDTGDSKSIVKYWCSSVGEVDESEIKPMSGELMSDLEELVDRQEFGPLRDSPHVQETGWETMT